MEDPKTQALYAHEFFHRVTLPNTLNAYFARFNWRRFNTKNALRDSVSLVAIVAARPTGLHNDLDSEKTRRHNVMYGEKTD
jgi:hypothetical protein